MAVSETLPERLNALLETKAVGKSQAQICRDTGIDRQTLKRLLEDDDWKPRYPTLEKLARYLDTSVEYLLTGQDSAPQPADLDELRARVELLERQLKAILEADDQVLARAVDAARRLSL